MTLNSMRLQVGGRGPVIRIAFDHDVLVLLRADKAKRSGADGMAIEVFAAAVGHDANRAVGEIPQHGSEGLLQVKDDGVVVGRVNVVDLRIGAGLGAAQFCRSAASRRST